MIWKCHFCALKFPFNAPGFASAHMMNHIKMKKEGMDDSILEEADRYMAVKDAN